MILLFISIFLVAIVFLVRNKIENYNIEKIKNYSENLTEFNCKDSIKNKGYISEDEALRIVAVSMVNRNDKQIKMKEYIKTVDSIEIELVENYKSESNNKFSSMSLGDIESQGTYWKITLDKKVVLI